MLMSGVPLADEGTPGKVAFTGNATKFTYRGSAKRTLPEGIQLIPGHCSLDKAEHINTSDALLEYQQLPTVPI